MLVNVQKEKAEDLGNFGHPAVAVLRT